MCFARAKFQEALVLESLDKPITVGLGWLFNPIPCCSVTRPFRVGKYHNNFETKKIQTKDEKTVIIDIDMKYRVDVSSDDGSTTFNGLVRADMIPRMFGIFHSAIGS